MHYLIANANARFDRLEDEGLRVFAAGVCISADASEAAGKWASAHQWAGTLACGVFDGDVLVDLVEFSGWGGMDCPGRFEVLDAPTAASRERCGL